MSVLWRRGKAALAVLLALGLVCNGPDTRVFAEALGPTEQKAYLSTKLTDVDDNAFVKMADIAQKLEASDEEKVSDDAVTPDGGATSETESVDVDVNEDGAGDKTPPESGDGTGDETPSGSGDVTGDETPSEDKDEAGNETPSGNGDGAEDVESPDSNEADGSSATDGEGGDDIEVPDGDENESENPDEDGKAEDSDEDDEDKDSDIIEDENTVALEELVFPTMEIELESPQTSAARWARYAARSHPYVQLAEGYHEKWIERIQVPAYAVALYNAFVEGADNDTTEDILIGDSYYNTYKCDRDTDGNVRSGGYPFYTIECGKSQDAINSASDKFYEVAAYAQAVLDAFDRDHPEVFWLGATSIGLKWSQNSTGYTAIYFLDFSNIRKTGYATEAAIKEGINLRDSQISTIQATISSSDTVERIKGFDDWLTKNNEYNTAVIKYGSGSLDTDNHMAWECISALAGREGEEGPVCEGYARAFKVLCDSVGIRCVLVDGEGKTSQGSEGHMWNNVKVGDTWYAVDVTWDDPAGGSSGKLSGHENQNWLLVGSETLIGANTFGETHLVANRATLPGNHNTGGVEFVNGPVLSSERYVIKPNVTITFTQNPQSVVFSGSQVNIVAPTVTKEDGTKVEAPNITYSYRRNGDANFTDGRPVNVGTYEVKAKVAEGADYAAGESSNILTLTITQAPLTITAANQTIESGDSISVDVSKASANKLLGSDKLTDCVLSVEGSYVNVGTYDITVKNAKITSDGKDVTGNYNISYAKGTLTVTPAMLNDKTNTNQSIAMGDGKFEAPTFEDKNGTKVSGTVSYTYGDEVCSETELVSKLSKLKEGDTGKISYSFKPDSPNFEVPAQGTITFTIVSVSFMMNNEKATLDNTVTVKNSSPVYGDTWEQVLSLNSGLVAKFKDGQDTDSTHFTLSVSGTIGQAGSMTYRVQYNGTISGTSFQNVTVCEGKINVQKAPLTITVNSHAVTYGEAPSNNGVTYDGFKNGENASSLSGTLSYSYGGYSAQSNAGEYVLSTSGLSSDNYEITYKPGKLTVAKRVIDVKWQGEEKVTYDGAEHALIASVADTSSIVNGDDVQITCTGNMGTSAGTYNAIAAVNNANYAISEGTGSKAFIIEPKKLAFIWSGDTKYTYDGKEHGVTVALDESSVVSGDKVEFTHEDIKGMNAGEYTARVISVSNPNYTIAGSETATMKWVIERRSIVDAKVELDEKVLIYNAKPQMKEVKSVTLTVDGEAKTLDGKTEYMIEGATNTDAGNYTLTVSGIGNYTGSVTATYTIEKASEPVNKPTAEDVAVTTKAEGLDGVVLLEGWKWEDPDVELVPGGSVTVYATVEKPDNYNITEANKEEFRVEYQVGKLPELVPTATDTSYTIGVGNGATIKSTGALKEFKEVKVDGNVVDASRYTLKEGSTILTFTKSYMDSLSVGKHTVELFYTVGSVAVDMTVVKKAEPSTPPTAPSIPSISAAPEATTTTVDVTTTAANAAGAVLSPKTGQEDMTYMYWLIALAALAGAGVCAKAADRNRKSAR